MKAQSLVLACGDAGQRGVETATLRIKPCDVAGGFKPAAVGFLQCETTQEKTAASDGEGFTCGIGVAKGVEQQRFIARSHADTETQRGGTDGGGEKKGRNDKGGTAEGHDGTR